ncbi:threonine synthase [Pyruvatibacter sp.]
MRYVSTRGDAPILDFEDVLLSGLARDGGLYVPESWPTFSAADFADMAGRPYTDVATRIVTPFAPSIAQDDIASMVDAAYSTFSHPAVAPLAQLDANEFLLELFHGPTLAFKDLAMQLLGQLFSHVLTKRGEKVTIVAATSGDTGGAAIEAFAGLEAVNIVVLHPKGRVSDVQRRQMTTVKASNVHNVALDGNFDDCQAIVKAMFNDLDFRDRVKLAAVNSINWSRILAQVVYYVTAATTLGAPHRKVSFSVPTGNFGDIFAGYVAKRMGLPIDKLIVATNINDILDRTLKTGSYTVEGVTPTDAPSMDIQVSSNFERLLFEAYGRDASKVRAAMGALTQSGSFTIDDPAISAIRNDFGSARVSNDAMHATMQQVFATLGMQIDPHTAVGLAAARDTLDPTGAPMVTLATAHPAKFPAAVEKATGQHPSLPPHLNDLFDREEHMTAMPNDLGDMQRFVEEKIAAS